MELIYVYQEIRGLREILKESRDDVDMCKMAKEELESAVEKEKEIQQELLLKMLPKDEADSRNCILEVRAGDFTGFILDMTGFIYVLIS
jgi:peptide chain release factor 1